MPLFSSFQDFYGAILFDTRDNTWTDENTTNSISFALNEVIPILSPFSIRSNIDIIYQDKVDDSILTKTFLTACIMCSTSGGSYFTATNGGTIYRGDVYEGEPWRLLMLILAFIINLFEIFS
jgi:hypothetical protein